MLEKSKTSVDNLIRTLLDETKSGKLTWESGVVDYCPSYLLKDPGDPRVSVHIYNMSETIGLIIGMNGMSVVEIEDHHIVEEIFNIVNNKLIKDCQ